jgi:hypothetical protein
MLDPKERFRAREPPFLQQKQSFRRSAMPRRQSIKGHDRMKTATIHPADGLGSKRKLK